MALLALFSEPDAVVVRTLQGLYRPVDLAPAPSEAGLLRVVRDRPVSGAVIDVRTVEGGRDRVALLERLASAFPGLPLIVASPSLPEPSLLLAAGRIANVRMAIGLEAAHPELLRPTVDWALAQGPASLARRLRSLLAPWHRRALSLAIDSVHLRWDSGDFARHMGLGRRGLSKRLRRDGLPPPGRLLNWTRIFYAAWWLPDPGRTCASVAGQLEYSHRTALSRMIKSTLGVSATELVVRGGLEWAWLRFLGAHPGLIRQGAGRGEEGVRRAAAVR